MTDNTIDKASIAILRGSDGVVYSAVLHPDEKNVNNPLGVGVVIDRKNRLLDLDAIRRRAEHIARMVNVKVIEDLRWPCAVLKNKRCRCPECVEKGRGD